METLIAFVLLAAFFTALALGKPSARAADPELLQDFQSLRQAGSGMSLRTFRSVREKNQRERERFGDGKHAPYWPKRSWNDHSTLRRGVWVDDSVTVPSNRVLDAFREEHQKKTRVIKFTLVEGEQDAPYGKDGAMIRVRATVATPGELRDASGALKQLIPTINVSPVNHDDGWWSTSFMGSLPCEMSAIVSASERTPE